MNISVVIPIYNGGRTICRALKSIKQQDLQPFEVLIINDGSTDNTLEVINDYIKTESCNSIKVISKKNGGVSSARNLGLKHAKGDLIALLDSDDEWLPNKLSLQMQIFQEVSDCYFVGGLIYQAKKNGRIREIKLIDLVFKNYFQPSTVVFKKEIIDKIGYFDENQKYAEEGNYFMRIAKKYKCVLINEQLVVYNQGKSGFGESGLSANLKEMERGELKNLRFAFKEKYINAPVYLMAVTFSVLKYLRRIIIVSFRQ